MTSSAALREQIESAFQHRYPAVLTPAARTIREVAATGIAEIDELLNGGLPVGAISELTGPTSSGRTSIAMAFVAQRTQESVCVWIDVKDSFDPESAAASGVDLNRLLWVRGSQSSSPMASQAQHNESISASRNAGRKSQPWIRLDKVLRATDLLLQAGGFAAIVLDLGDESIEHGRRIPLATWFRFRQAADRTRCSVIVLGRASYAQSSAAVVLECERGQISSANGTVIRAFDFGARRRRERFSPPTSSPITSIDRKPPVSTWSAEAVWNAQRRA